MIDLDGERVRLRELTLGDAPFLLRLFNEPSFLRFIGDRQLRTLADAESYLRKGPLEMYQRLGFGSLLVERKSDGAALGICGVLKRDGLDDPDIGFAFLPEYWGQGYASEAAERALRFARETVGLKRILAITAEDNHSSARLLDKLGLRFERRIVMPGEDAPLRLYATQPESR